MVSSETIYLRIGVTVLLAALGFVFTRNRGLFVAQSVWLIILTSFNTMAGDWTGNAGIYDQVTSLTTGSPLNYLMNAMILLFKHWGCSFVVYNGVLALMATGIIIYVIYADSRHPNLVMSFWYVFPLIDNVIQKRAYYGLGLVILALTFLLKEQRTPRDYVWYGLLILSASSIHAMYFYFLTLPLFLIFPLKWTLVGTGLFVVMGLAAKGAFSAIVNLLMGPSMTAKSDLYFGTLAGTASTAHTLFWAGWQLTQLLIIWSVSQGQHDERSQTLLRMNIWGLTLIPFNAFNPVFTRVFRAVLLFNDLAVANTYQIEDLKINKQGLRLVLCQLIFLGISFYMMDLHSDLGVNEMVFPIFANNGLLNWW